MLARKFTLIHPAGQRIETPLLIPSFSSKGFGVDADGRSEVNRILSAAQEYLTDSLLVSAYDVYYRHLDVPDPLPTELAVVDSGGYETSDLHDLSSTYYQRVAAADWDEQKLFEVLDKWPSFAPAMFVTFDRADKPISLADQIDRARSLKARYPKQLVTFLIKPETKKQHYVQIETVAASAAQFAGFAAIGVTEKELGNSTLDRMTRLAKLRLALDDARLNEVPIHVFGSLDPISVCLYFISGAAIFDGLTWLRYAYFNDLAVYRHNAGALNEDLSRTDTFITLSTLQRNLSYLRTLTMRMRKFLNKHDFSHFGAHADLVRQAHESLQTRMTRTI
jgi:hypothetical protein